MKFFWLILLLSVFMARHVQANSEWDKVADKLFKTLKGDFTDMEKKSLLMRTTTRWAKKAMKKKPTAKPEKNEDAEVVANVKVSSSASEAMKIEQTLNDDKLKACEKKNEELISENKRAKRTVGKLRRSLMKLKSTLKKLLDKMENDKKKAEKKYDDCMTENRNMFNAGRQLLQAYRNLEEKLNRMKGPKDRKGRSKNPNTKSLVEDVEFLSYGTGLLVPTLSHESIFALTGSSSGTSVEERNFTFDLAEIGDFVTVPPVTVTGTKEDKKYSWSIPFSFTPTYESTIQEPKGQLTIKVKFDGVLMVKVNERDPSNIIIHVQGVTLDIKDENITIPDDIDVSEGEKAQMKIMLRAFLESKKYVGLLNQKITAQIKDPEVHNSFIL